jgi:hypothetical protein
MTVLFLWSIVPVVEAHRVAGGGVIVKGADGASIANGALAIPVESIGIGSAN